MRLKDVALSTGNLFRLAPSMIQIDPGYNVPGREFDASREKDAGLMESIRAEGVKDPLVIRTEGDSILLVQGHRRLGAVKALIASGHDVASIPAIHEGLKVTPKDRNYDLLISNSGEPLTPLQAGVACQRLRDDEEADAEIARRAGVTVRHVQTWLALHNAPDAIKALIEAGTVSATLAYETMQSHGAEKAADVLAAAQAEAAAAGKTRITAKTMRTAKGKSLLAESAAELDDQAAADRRSVVDSAGVYEANKRSIFLDGELQAIAESPAIARKLVKLLNR